MGQAAVGKGGREAGKGLKVALMCRAGEKLLAFPHIRAYFGDIAINRAASVLPLSAKGSGSFMIDNIQELEEKLGYHFKNPRLLEQALTHASWTPDIHKNYERLEFLGDRILGVTVADMLCTTFANEPEGNLSQRFVALVCKETVAEVMRGLGADKHIIAQDHSVSRSVHVMCDIGEAIIAAIYADSGDMAAAQDFVRRNWLALIDRTSKPRKDFKTQLQEVASRKGLAAPAYKMLKKTGSDHEPEFRVEVCVGEGLETEGCGRNVKTAEQEAAHAMLIRLGAING